MNIHQYKATVYQMLEDLKAAQYIDWLKAYLCIHLIYGSVRLLILTLALLIQMKGADFNLLIFVKFFVTIATQIIITTILSCAVSAFLSFMCVKYMPRLFVAFSIIKDIMFSIALTIGTSTLSSPMTWLLGALAFIVSLVVMFGFTYLLIKLVIRNAHKRLQSTHH
jgi:hypothetical protein